MHMLSTHTRMYTHRHTDTQTLRHIDTQTHRHTDTQHIHAHTHTRTCTRANHSHLSANDACAFLQDAKRGHEKRKSLMMHVLMHAAREES